MEFDIHEVEILNRRNKGNRPCDEDWKNHDHNLQSRHVDTIGCRTPYQPHGITKRSCSSSNEMKLAQFSLRFDDYGQVPPCRAIQKVLYTYTDVEFNQNVKEHRPGRFWVGVLLRKQEFKEIQQKK